MSVPGTIDHFEIPAFEAELANLHDRLDGFRWPLLPPEVRWLRGVPADYLREMVAYWRDEFNWEHQVRMLNRFPQFITGIDGQRIHFLHIRSTDPDAIPLLLVHGWPGSFVEFIDVIEQLSSTRCRDTPFPRSFHLVIPSIPGFGFSTPLGQWGWTPHRIAQAFAELMRRVGYSRYGVHGGDWGSRIAPEIGRIAPGLVIGVHVNAATQGFVPTVPVDQAALSAKESARIDALDEFRTNGNAFFRLQATTPLTIGYALDDSPVGLLAWIIEKFQQWSHDPGRITRDRILTNVTIYWLTQSATSSAQIYYENAQPTPPLVNSGVATGVAAFAEDMPIRRFAEEFNTIVHWTDFDRGGHFAALEEPVLLAGDIRQFFGNLPNC